jgi:multidrug resistance efflux pump
MTLEISRWRAVALALAVVGPVVGAPAEAQTTRKPASPVARSDVRALAHLEPESGAIVIGARPGMRVEKVLVAAGQDVMSGELLAVLEGHDQRERQLALAEAQRDAARFQRRLRREQLVLERARFDRLKQPRLDSLRTTIADLKGKLDEAAAHPAHTGPDSAPPAPPVVPAPTGATAPHPAGAGATAPRPGPAGATAPHPAGAGATAPHPAGAGATMPVLGLGAAMVPPDGRMVSAQLRSELSRTEIQLKEFEASLDQLESQRKLEDEQSADDSPESVVLDRQVELARADLAGAEVRAPVAGRVLSVSIHAGEVSPGPLLTLGDVRTMVARAEVFQTDVLDVAVGDPAEVHILGRTVAGEVTRVGATVARNTITSLDPADLADRRVVDVVVRLADPALAARLVNMQVEVAIRKRPTAGTAR